MDAENTGLGSKLSHLAKLKGITQGELALKTGVSRITINRFFTGKSEIKAGDLSRLVGILGIDLEAQIDAEFEKQMGGAVAAGPPIAVSKDIEMILGSLEAPVKKTLLEQIHWWGKSVTNSQSEKALQRLQSYINEVRA